MTPDEKVSDLVMKRDECPKCGAVWLNNRHIWKTGTQGDELDLAGLVCNVADYPDCINPKKGQEGGDTWEKRLNAIEELYEAEHKRQTEEEDKKR
jgi:Zn-finger nucleic acid-binding protein